MDILTGNVRKLYLRLLGASVGSGMISPIFGMVDSIMIGQYYGPVGTAAVAVFTPAWTIFYSTGILAGVGGSVLFANRRGAGDEREAREYFTLSVIFGLILSALVMVMMAFFNEPLFRFFGSDDELLPLAQDYLKAVWWCIPCCVFSNITASYLRNDGRASLATKAVLIAGFINVVGDYLFVFVFDMGIIGAGIATSASHIISTLIMCTHFVSKRCTIKFVRVTRPLHKLRRISVIGFPTAISDLSMGVINILFNRQVMFYLGSDALAVYGVVNAMFGLAQCCSYGIGQAAQPIMSQNYGAGKTERIRECLKYAVVSSVIFGVFWCAVFEAFPVPFMHLFMKPTQSVLDIAPAIIRTYCISTVFIPLNIFGTYYFQAILRPRISLVSSLARGFVLPGIFVLALPAVFGANAIWYSMIIAEGAVCLYTVRQTKACDKNL